MRDRFRILTRLLVGPRVRWLGLFGLGAALWWELPDLERSASAAGKNKGLAVSSEAPRAAKEAMAVLTDPQAPGNAVDAAVAAALVSGVVNSTSSGIGGGGFVTFWDAKTKQTLILDFREVAPRAVDEAEFESRPFAPEARGKAVGVPGEVRGLYALQQRYGKLPWERVVKVAANVAEKGYSVAKHLHRALGSSQENLAADPGLSSLWLPKGKLPPLGAWVTNPRLAKTLTTIAEQGPNAFYDGPIASEIVETARAHGSAMTLNDLKTYQVKERTPLRVEYDGATVYTMPPPSAGGYLLVQTLLLYPPEQLRKLGFNSPAYVHALGEAFRAAFADRMRYFADPDFVQVDLEMLLGKDRLDRRRRAIALDRTHALPRFGLEEHGTHHLVTRDADGNVVSLTTTVNTAFGADLMTQQSGIVLNDELGDFSKNAWVEAFGLLKSPNRARGGARPVSSMTPTIVVRDDEVVLAVGGSGGMLISTDVTQTVLHQILFDRSPLEVVSAPRVQIPFGGSSIRVPTRLGPDFIADLEARGEVVTTYETAGSAVQMLRVKNGAVSAAADPQKFGRAIVR